MKIGELATQAQVAARIRYVCDKNYQGDARRMAKACGASASVLRDILRGRYVRDNLFDGVVRDVSKLREVHGTWIRTGHGRPFARGGETEPAGPSPEVEAALTLLAPPADEPAPQPQSEPTPEPQPEPEPAKEPTPMPAVKQPIPVPQPSPLDLFAAMLGRIESLEKTIAELRAAPAPPDARTIEALSKEVRSVAAKTDSRCAAVEGLVTEYGARVEEQGRTLARQEQALVAQARDIADHEQAVQSLSADVSALLNAATEDHHEHPAVLPLRAEDDYGDDELMAVSDYLKLDGERPDRLRTCGVAAKAYSAVLANYELNLRLPQVKHQDAKTNLYRLGSFRMLVRFLNTRDDWAGRKLVFREILAYALGASGVDRLPQSQGAKAAQG